MKTEKIFVLGNDGRMEYAAGVFRAAGCEVYRDTDASMDRAVVVLPPPVKDSAINEILPRLTGCKAIYGGAVSVNFIRECEHSGISVTDYLKWSSVTGENAALTAKGIIRQAREAKAVLEKSSCLVTGYGYCGKAISQELLQCGAYVDVMVRRENQSSEILENGCGFVLMSDLSEVSMEKYSYIFNTVPALILTENLLDGFSDNVMIFDIASAPGGTDFAYCRQRGIYAVNSLGIPGKEYPREAGEIIARAILQDLN